MLNGINGMLRNNKTKYNLFVLVFQIVRIIIFIYMVELLSNLAL